MANKKQRDTAKLAYEYIMRPGARENHFRKIIKALNNHGRGTSYQIAVWAGLKPDQVWKRMSELEAAKTVFDTTLRLPSPSGLDAIVWDLNKNAANYVNLQPTEQIKPGTITNADYANKLLGLTKQPQMQIDFKKKAQQL